MKSRCLTLEQMIDFELSKYGHKVSCSQMPEPILEMMSQKKGKKTHGYNTRYKSIPNIQKHTSTVFNQSFIIKSIAQYQKLPI